MIQYTLVNPVPKKSYHHSGPSPVRQNKLRICQDKGAARAKDIWISTALVVGPSEKEKEGIGIACDVIKVKGKDLATSGSLRGDRVRWHVGDPFRWYVLFGPPLRKPWDRNDSPISNKFPILVK